MNSYKDLLKYCRRDIIYKEIKDPPQRIDHSEIVKEETKVYLKKQKKLKKFY